MNAAEDRWAVFALAWPGERAARMDLSLARVRRWLEADGCVGWGSDGEYRRAARHRALEFGLTGAESWMVHGVLSAEERRLSVPGARVQERARGVIRAMEAARVLIEAEGGSGSRAWVPEGPTGRSGASVGLLEVERFAVTGHEWDISGDAGSVVEDMPWDIGDRAGLRAVPVGWWGIVFDPLVMGVDGNDWRRCSWEFGAPRPEWLTSDIGHERVMAVLQPWGWSGAPIRADWDDVARYLPTRRLRRVAWLVPGVSGVGWAIAWHVER